MPLTQSKFAENDDVYSVHSEFSEHSSIWIHFTAITQFHFKPVMILIALIDVKWMNLFKSIWVNVTNSQQPMMNICVCIIKYIRCIMRKSSLSNYLHAIKLFTRTFFALFVSHTWIGDINHHVKRLHINDVFSVLDAHVSCECSILKQQQKGKYWRNKRRKRTEVTF